MNMKDCAPCPICGGTNLAVYNLRSMSELDEYGIASIRCRSCDTTISRERWPMKELPNDH